MRYINTHKLMQNLLMVGKHALNMFNVSSTLTSATIVFIYGLPMLVQQSLVTLMI